MQPDIEREENDFDPKPDELAFDEFPDADRFVPLPDNFVEQTMLIIRAEAQLEAQTFRLHWTDFIYPLGIAAMGTTLLLAVQLMIINYFARLGNWELTGLGLDRLPISATAGLWVAGGALLCCFTFYLSRE